ncbi:MAG: hypothetical protein Q7S35_00145, partial [Candidatus Limnocylindrales bacterium]|nr:hypothetical protein [Candidatus Limnocylindrales bacterium]
MTTPDGGSESDGPERPPPAEPASESPTARVGPVGASTFTIEGRSAPALFVVGWLASLLGFGLVMVAALSGGGVAALGL